MRTETIMDGNMREWPVRHRGVLTPGSGVHFEVFPELVQRDDSDPSRQMYKVEIPIEVLTEIVGRVLQMREEELLSDEMGKAFLDRVTGHTK